MKQKNWKKKDTQTPAPRLGYYQQRVVDRVFVDHWSTYNFKSQLNSLQCMHVTSRDKCILLIPGDSILRQEVPELESDHEEADTLLLLRDSLRRQQALIIVSLPKLQTQTYLYFVLRCKRPFNAKDHWQRLVYKGLAINFVSYIFQLSRIHSERTCADVCLISCFLWYIAFGRLLVN